MEHQAISASGGTEQRGSTGGDWVVRKRLIKEEARVGKNTGISKGALGRPIGGSGKIGESVGGRAKPNFYLLLYYCILIVCLHSFDFIVITQIMELLHNIELIFI